MPTSTISSYSDQHPLPAKSPWEDPFITVERELEVSAQGGPPGGGPARPGSAPGFLGPLGTSGGTGTCL